MIDYRGMLLAHHLGVCDAAVALEGAGVLGGLDVPPAPATGSGVSHGPRSKKGTEKIIIHLQCFSFTKSIYVDITICSLFT